MDDNHNKTPGNNSSIAQEIIKHHSTREKKVPEAKNLGRVTINEKKKSYKGISDGYKKCEHVLSMLKKHPLSCQFVNLLEIPGYNEAVDDPVDLTTLEHKLKSGNYKTSDEFAADGNKIWKNVINTFKSNDDLCTASNEMANYFKSLMREVGDIPLNVKESHHGHKVLTKLIKTSVPAVEKKVVTEKPMTDQEKILLRQNITRLSQDKLQGIIDIVQSAVDASKNSDTLEFDLDKLPTEITRKLDQFVKSNLPDFKKKSKQKESKLL